MHGAITPFSRFAAGGGQDGLDEKTMATTSRLATPCRKDIFTFYDVFRVHEHFNDPEWDGEPAIVHRIPAASV